MAAIYVAGVCCDPCGAMQRIAPQGSQQEVGGGCEDWMELAQDRDKWRALVSTVMNLRVPKMRGIS